MATVNTIKTRILNRYDLLDSYNKNNDFIPYKGEICIAEIPTTESESGLTPPAIGIKVGDGDRPFSELDWIQAIAGDVAAWLKELTGIADIDTQIADLEGRKLATVEELSELEETVKSNVKAIADINTKIGDEAIGDKTVTKAIADLQASVGNSPEGLGSQVAGLKTDLTKLQGRVTTVENDINTATTGLKDRVTAVEGKLVNIDTTVVAKINASEEATNAKIKAITDDYLKAADKQALQTQIDTILNNPDTEGVIDSINEFTQYIEEHGTIADGFRTDINGLKTKVDTGDLTVSTYVTETLRQYATVDTLGGVAERVKAIEDAPYATTANVATAKGEVIGASGDAKTADTIYGAKAYAADAAATAKSEAISDAATAADAKYELKDVAKSLVEALAGAGNTSTVKDNAETIAGHTKTLNAMNVTDNVNGVVTKVDQANGKISVTHKKITMDEFDPDATFIFYCGTASEVI